MSRTSRLLRSTTVVAVRDRAGRTAMAGDGQVTLGSTVLKSSAVKVRKLAEGSVLAGFAGASGDALTIFDLFEQQLGRAGTNVARAAVEVSRRWRSDRALRRMDALLLVAGPADLLIVSGSGEVLAPDEPFAGIGSGAPYAVAALKALWAHTDLPASELLTTAMRVASELCIYTNSKVTLLTL